MTKREALLTKVRESVIGDDRLIEGPFGRRRLTYADYTASGRALSFIEDFLRQRVLPYYANTHSETSLTGLQTTLYREEARNLIRRSVGADDDYAVIFCGSGATGAINRLIDILNIRIPADLEARYGLARCIPPQERPVVLIGPYEHHSNELPWRETIADVVAIEEDADGRIDLDHLERELDRFRDRPLRIGSFSAASNVTGIISDRTGISSLLHRYGAYAFWDYAAAAPYLKIDMAGPRRGGGAGAKERPYMDALFMSPHKFVGGPGSPGVLVLHKRLMANTVPARPGGGTVSYVNTLEHLYITDREHREEGGTPAIVESIRAGLVFQLKEGIGVGLIEEREQKFVRWALDAWCAHADIHILGNPDLPRLGIISFVIRHGKRNLHHDFVVALLNDLFGVQARGGCSCAGPYGHRLLHIDLDQSQAFEQSIVAGSNGIKPGWVRLGFNYFFSERLVRYLIEAVLLIASHGWKLLPQYTFDPDTGIWRHIDAHAPVLLRLADVDFCDPGTTDSADTMTAGEEILDRHLEEARRIFAVASARPAAPRPADGTRLRAEAEALRWFPLPAEAAEELAGK